MKFSVTNVNLKGYSSKLITKRSTEKLKDIIKEDKRKMLQAEEDKLLAYGERIAEDIRKLCSSRIGKKQSLNGRIASLLGCGPLF